jgi:hypothetical protein
MDTHQDTEPYTTFMPKLDRYILFEMWSLLLSITLIAAFLAVLQVLSWETVLPGLVIGFIGAAIGGAFSRRLRRIVIGDTWISGPTGNSSETATIQFGTVDPEATGVSRGRIHVKSLGGLEIAAKAAWYAPEDVEEIKRLLRDRCTTHGASMVGQ